MNFVKPGQILTRMPYKALAVCVPEAVPGTLSASMKNFMATRRDARVCHRGVDRSRFVLPSLVVYKFF